MKPEEKVAQEIVDMYAKTVPNKTTRTIESIEFSTTHRLEATIVYKSRLKVTGAFVTELRKAKENG